MTEKFLRCAVILHTVKNNFIKQFAHSTKLRSDIRTDVINTLSTNCREHYISLILTDVSKDTYYFNIFANSSKIL